MKKLFLIILSIPLLLNAQIDIQNGALKISKTGITIKSSNITSPDSIYTKSSTGEVGCTVALGLDEVSGNIANPTTPLDTIFTSYIYKENITHTFLYFEDSAVVVPVTTSLTFVQITNATNDLFITGESDGFTISGDTIYILSDGDYFVNWHFSIEGTNGITFESRARNSILCKGKKAVTTNGPGNYMPLSGFTYCSFSAGDHLVLEYTSTTGNADATFIDGTIYIEKKHE